VTEQEARAVMNGWSPEKRAVANKGWLVVNDEIVARASAKKPRPKVYEVHHEAQVAMVAFVEGFEKGGITLARSMAREAIKLPEPVAG